MSAARTMTRVGVPVFVVGAALAVIGGSSDSIGSSTQAAVFVALFGMLLGQLGAGLLCIAGVLWLVDLSGRRRQRRGQLPPPPARYVP